MSELISGKEALIALANGEEVEYTNSCTPSWHELSVSGISINEIVNPKFNKFRLKPRTITINGVEVPCNKSKHNKDDVVWVISIVCENWYDWIYGSDCDSNTLYWETEDEIKQVVSALRSVFKGGVK